MGTDNTVTDILKSVSFSATKSFTVASEEILFLAKVLLAQSGRTHLCLKSMVYPHTTTWLQYLLNELSNEYTHNFTYLWPQKRWSQYAKYQYTKSMNNVFGLKPNNRIKTGFVKYIYTRFRWLLWIASEITDNRQKAVYTANYFSVSLLYLNTVTGKP